MRDIIGMLSVSADIGLRMDIGQHADISQCNKPLKQKVAASDSDNIFPGLRMWDVMVLGCHK